MQVKVTVTPDKSFATSPAATPRCRVRSTPVRTALVAAARAIMLALTDPSIPANDGCFRPLEIICPPRTIFTAERPAAVSTYWETMLYAADLIWKAMAPVLPGRLTAGHFLSVCAPVIVGLHPDTGSLFILVEPSAGGWGAGATKDGENGMVCVGDGETYTVPIEVCETALRRAGRPVRVRHH